MPEIKPVSDGNLDPVQAMELAVAQGIGKIVSQPPQFAAAAAMA